tara:strand:+ start:2785 stop:3720 length:936 start_codon:yes stop_codon:yes gene_type:complete
MIKAKSLRKGDCIGIISPSYWTSKKTLLKTMSFFERQGYTLKIGNSNSLRWGPFAGKPEQRAEDINSMFKDPDIKAIICARGGYGANRVLDLLDYKLIKKNPKIFIGFSDITAYLTSITQKTGLVTFHGPMLVSFKERLIKYNLANMLKVLSRDEKIKIRYPNKLKPKILRSGNAKGKLWGGNMTLLINRFGTNDYLNTDNAILFLEDIDEYLYAFERMLVQMRNAGMFDKVKGLIFGELKEMKDQEIPFERDTDQIIMDICGDLEIPIITNFPCGHGIYQATIPLSINAELNVTDLDSIYLKLLEPAVET